MQPAKLGAPHLQPHLALQDQLLVRCQLESERFDATQLLAEDDERLELGAEINELELVLVEAVERDGCLDRSLHRAAARKRAPAIVDPRDEALLKGVRDVSSAGEAPTTTGVRDQLECRLAIAVLEVLLAQSVAMESQQDLALGVRHPGHGLGLVDGAQRTGAGGWQSAWGTCRRLRSGRHMGMSRASARRPPSQFATAATQPARRNSTTARP